MSAGTTTAEERLREVAARLRERAASLPAGAAIEADPSPDPSAPAERPPAAKPERGAPKHWAETDHDDQEETPDAP